jgi:hypothetical protein
MTERSRRDRNAGREAGTRAAAPGQQASGSAPSLGSKREGKAT